MKKKQDQDEEAKANPADPNANANDKAEEKPEEKSEEKPEEKPEEKSASENVDSTKVDSNENQQ